MERVQFLTPHQPSPYSKRYMDFLRQNGWGDDALNMLAADVFRFECYVMKESITIEDGLDVLVEPWDKPVLEFFEILGRKIKKLATAERNFRFQKRAAEDGHVESERIMSGTHDDSPAALAPVLHIHTTDKSEPEPPEGEEVASAS